jgi:anti-sigma factor RsiW
MTCQEIEQELVAYHFATLDAETRGRLEAHLVKCSACIAAFVDIKRAVETSEREAGPSAELRVRLRRAVSDELGLTRPRWVWWERPVAIAVAASAVLVAGAALRTIASIPAAPPHALELSR